jgi:DNA end-binding protein Ku
MLRPVEDGIVMQQLLNAEEVRSIKDIEIPETEVKPQELKLAQMLIEQQSAETFDPSQYKDTVTARIEAAIEKKVQGQEITLAEPEEKGAQVIDLMDALRASLERKAPAKSSPKTEEAAPAPARKPAKRAQQVETEAAAAPAPRKVARGKR